MPSFQRHVFVCINERAPDHPKGSCKARGGVEVRDRLKSELSARGLGKRIRANNAGCLDQCEAGVTVVVYPEQVWYGHVTVDDIPEIVEKHLIGGEVVARLLLPDQPHLGGRTSFPAIEIGEGGAPVKLFKLGKPKPKPEPEPEPKPEPEPEPKP